VRPVSDDHSEEDEQAAMRHIVEAGTDAASLLLFDPGALPDDFEAQFRRDSVDLLERMTREGTACWIPTDADGAYLLHAYVDEPVSSMVARHATRQEVIERFRVPSGQLYFAGSEYAFKEDDSFLRKHPHMGGNFGIKPGVYRLTVFWTAFPEGMVEQLFQTQASPWEYRLWASMSALVPLAIAAWIGLVVILFTTVRVPFPSFLAPLLVVLVGLPFVVRRNETYRAAKERFAALEREYPSIVAVLETRG
jgi:hypothetical protein